MLSTVRSGALSVPRPVLFQKFRYFGVAHLVDERRKAFLTEGRGSRSFDAMLRAAFIALSAVLLTTLAATACSSDDARTVVEAGTKSDGDVSEKDAAAAEDTGSEEKDSAPKDATTYVEGAVCPASCDPQVASGSGDSTCPIGYAWTSNGCLLLKGCKGCIGTDCDKLYTYQECQDHAVECAVNCPP